MSRTQYEPAPTTTDDELCAMARRCGEDLRPSDRRSRWIDTHPKAAALRLVDIYHEGQAVQYESERW